MFSVIDAHRMMHCIIFTLDIVRLYEYTSNKTLKVGIEVFLLIPTNYGLIKSADNNSIIPTMWVPYNLCTMHGAVYILHISTYLYTYNIISIETINNAFII